MLKCDVSMIVNFTIRNDCGFVTDLYKWRIEKGFSPESILKVNQIVKLIIKRLQ